MLVNSQKHLPYTIWCHSSYISALNYSGIFWVFYLLSLLLGQHNFDFGSVSRFHEIGSEAGLISIYHFKNLPQLFIMRLHSIVISHFMCAWDWSEAGNLSHFIVPLSSAEVVRVVLFIILFHNLINQPILDSELSSARCRVAGWQVSLALLWEQGWVKR